MTILISGGAGFIGPNLISRLHAAGHEVAVADNLSRGRRENLGKGVQLLTVDLACPESVEIVAKALHGRNVSEIWHLAANSDIPAFHAPAPFRHYFQFRDALRLATRRHVPISSWLRLLAMPPLKFGVYPLLLDRGLQRIVWMSREVANAFRGRACRSRRQRD